MAPRKASTTTEPPGTVDWNNRIVGHEDVDPGVLHANPLNWRVHPEGQQAALASVMGKVGWVQSVVVNRRTGSIVDGHLRVSLALQNGQPTVPVVWVDLSDEEEREMLATLDPIAMMAETDGRMLNDLLASVDEMDPALAAILDGLVTESASMEADAEQAKDSHKSAAGLRGNTVHQYNIVFDSAEQLQEWYAIVRTLRERSEQEGASVASVVVAALRSLVE